MTLYLFGNLLASGGQLHSALVRAPAENVARQLLADAGLSITDIDDYDVEVIREYGSTGLVVLDYSAES